MLQRRRARVQVGVTGKETALSRGQRRSHSVSASRFSAIKLDQTGIQWRPATQFHCPKLYTFCWALPPSVYVCDRVIVADKTTKMPNCGRKYDSWRDAFLLPIENMNQEFKYQQKLFKRAWRDRDTNGIFAHCSLIFYFLDFKFSNFVCPSELHPLIWFFFKNSFRKKKNIRKTAQYAFDPTIFIVLSIVLKLGTPLLHTQAQNTLLQNFFISL